MILFYSGSAGFLPGGKPIAEPERILRERATLMLSFFLVEERMQEQHRRFSALVKQKRKRKIL